MLFMAGRKRIKIEAKDARGLKYFTKIRGLLRVLHDAACQRDRAGNRELFMDEYMVLLLLGMFNPMLDSIRTLQDAADLEKVRRKLGLKRFSLGSFSEASRVFDSRLLEPILQKLLGQLKPLPHDPRLAEIQKVLTVVDGSVLRAASRMLWAQYQNDTHRAAKIHVQFELLRNVPVAAAVTAANACERDVLRHMLEPGRLYMIDRGYAKYAFLQEILDAGSSFVTRLKDDAVFEVLEERELSREALDAGVVRDAVVMVGSKKTKGHLPTPMRIVQVECTPHLKGYHTGRGGPQQGDTILLLTDCLDLPADLVALIYLYRWQIEIFFRFLKHVLNGSHLFSECQNGVELQVYAAILLCVAITLWTGCKVNKRLLRMATWYLLGLADIDELVAFLEKQPKVADAPQR